MANVTEQLTESGVEIVHAVPGRIRLRVPQLSEDMELAQQLERLALTTPGVTSIRINRAAESVIITYRADINSKTKIRSRLRSLIQSAGVPQSVIQPAQGALPEAKQEEHLEQAPQQQSRLVKDLAQQLAEARQQLTIQAERYESLQLEFQQQWRLVEDLQQQLAKLQQLKHDQPQQPSEDQAQLQRWANIGEWQLNKWRRRLYFG